MRRLIEYGVSLVIAAVLVWCALALKVHSPGWVRVRAGEVAVVSDYVRGTSTLVASPGIRWFVPYFQDVHVLDKTPAEFHMHGVEPIGDHDVPELVVRARDGTIFSFDDLTLRYQLANLSDQSGPQAELALSDSGTRERGRFLLVRALARGVLADELGRYSCEEIVDGANVDAARAAARTRLNARLVPHGIVVLEIPAATPRFDGDYEQQRLRRRVAEQQVALVAAERLKLTSELEQRRSQVTREQEVARAKLVGELESQRIAAETKRIAVVGEAESYKVEREAAAQRERAQLESQAEARGARYASETTAFAEKVAAVGASGEQAVRQAWIDALSGIELQLVPYELTRNDAEGDGARGSKR